MSVEEPLEPQPTEGTLNEVQAVNGLFENWYLDYASYVILERAVPDIEDGLKPVQRRALHALNVIDDGRFNKVANVIGQTMQYHPHGDASIGEAIVNLGQKELAFDCQGNWGDIRTGDSAAAARYIEVRLSKFAKEVVFNPQTTTWQLSYDGRKKEPVTLPVKFPMLLAMGVDGIAVGLSTRILPHNFIELIEASIHILQGKKVALAPDFLTGGMVDVSNYNDGRRGGKIRVRAKIKELDPKTLAITEIPYSTTTTSLIDSIVKAGEAGKIKIKKVIDNTAKDVEIQVQLAPGTSPDVTIDALYAFTDCEISISPNACVIVEEKPRFLSVVEILEYNTNHTKELLKKELEIKRGELKEKVLFSSLEKIFIENRIYRDIEECETWEAVIKTIDAGLEPYKKQFYREIGEDDIVKLTEIKIKRISKYDSFKADEWVKSLEAELEEVENHLAHLIDYTIAWFKSLLKKYGKGKERRTEIRSFDAIQATAVAANNQKLYVNRAEGFVGYGLKKDEFITECSDIDDVLVIRKNGVAKVVRIDEKVFVGKDILYVGIFRKNEERMVYNMLYLNGETGFTNAKRFQVLGVIRDKDYPLIPEAKGSKVFWLTANPNGEAETVTVQLSPASPARKKTFEFDFSTIEIKGRGAQGNRVTVYVVKAVKLKEGGKSTLGGLEVWYDATVGRLNTEKRGQRLGVFNAEDQIICLFNDGSYELNNLNLQLRFEPEQIVYLGKFYDMYPVTALYYVADTKTYMLKRFMVETTTAGKKFLYIPEGKNNKTLLATQHPNPDLVLGIRKDKKAKIEEVKIANEALPELKGWKTQGKKLPYVLIEEARLEETTFPDPDLAFLEEPAATDNQSDDSPYDNEKSEPLLLKKKDADTNAAADTGTQLDLWG